MPCTHHTPPPPAWLALHHVAGKCQFLAHYENASGPEPQSQVRSESATRRAQAPIGTMCGVERFRSASAGARLSAQQICRVQPPHQLASLPCMTAAPAADGQSTIRVRRIMMASGRYERERAIWSAQRLDTLDYLNPRHISRATNLRRTNCPQLDGP